MKTLSINVVTPIALLALTLVMFQTKALAGAPEKKIQGTQIIRISSNEGIELPEAKVKAGTTVIWVNQAYATVYIEFTSKQVTAACKSPIHFIVDADGSFVSNRIPMGAVASLCFVGKGEYTYRVKRASPQPTSTSKPQEFSGKVIVE